eukprot:1322404-Pyramimonas_sp.AAC.1
MFQRSALCPVDHPYYRQRYPFFSRRSPVWGANVQAIGAASGGSSRFPWSPGSLVRHTMSVCGRSARTYINQM